MLIISCWALGLPLSVVIKPSETPLEKTKFSFVSGCQLEITFWLGMGACSPPLSAGTLSGLSLCRPWAYCHNLYEFKRVSLLLCLEDTIYMESSIPSDSY